MNKILIGGRGNDYKNYTAALNAFHVPWEIAPVCTHIRSYAGLLLPGGGDMDPALYGEENLGSKNIDVQLDRQQLDLLHSFVRAKKPVLGICRGHQVINVYFGGNLIQHMDTWYLHSQDSGDAVHEITVSPGSLLHCLYQKTVFSVNSSHHQAVSRPGSGLIPIARSYDGTIEAMVHKTLPVLSLQWHPERMAFDLKRPDTVSGRPVFKYFLSAAGKH